MDALKHVSENSIALTNYSEVCLNCFTDKPQYLHSVIAKP